MAKTLLFIDTNILLDFYRAPQSDLSLEVFDSLVEHSDHLIISDQVKMEFQKNRNKTIQNYMRQLPYELDKSIKPPVLFSKTKDAEHFIQSVQSLQKEIEALRDKLKQVYDTPEEHDEAYKKILPIFEIDNSFNSCKQKRSLIDTIFLNAIMRFHRGMPPRKSNDLSIGDAFNWEWCLYCCSHKKQKNNLVILSRDGDFAEPTKKDEINAVLKEEFRNRVGANYTVKLERDLTPALKEIHLEIPESIETELDQIQKSSDTLDFPHRQGECIRCGNQAMFDVYCKKCGELVVGDADSECYYIQGERVFEMDPDPNGSGELLHCPHCRNARMRIEYGALCGYCQYMADKLFDED